MPRGLVVLALGAIVLCQALVYRPGLDYGFVYDDSSVVVERPAAWEEGFDRFFSTRHWGVGRHLTLLSLDADRRSPLDPRPFHRTNLALACLVTLLVYALARALGLAPGSALVGTALFAWHPTHVDAVVAIVGRAELLAALASLASLLLFLRRGRQPREGGPAIWAAHAALMFAGLESKESAACLPLLILAAGLLAPAGGKSRIPVRTLASLAFGALAYAALAWTHFADVSPVAYVDNPLAHVGVIERVVKASAVLAHYVALVVAPVDLRIDRSFATTSPSWALGVLATFAWTLLSVSLLRLRREHPRTVFLLAWLPLAFAATGNVAFATGTIMAERLLYLPSVGLCLLAGQSFEKLHTPGQRGLGAVVLASVLVWFAASTLDRGAPWESPEIYHRAAAERSPQSAKAWYDLGQYLAEGQPDAALAPLARAVEIEPSFERAVYLLAETRAQRVDAAAGAEVYRTFLERHPEHREVLMNLVRLEGAAGRREAALDAARRLFATDPEDALLRQILMDAESAALAARARSEGAVSP